MYVRAGRPAFARPCVGVTPTNQRNPNDFLSVFFRIFRFSIHSIFLTADDCCFAKNSMKPWVAVYIPWIIYIYIYNIFIYYSYISFYIYLIAWMCKGYTNTQKIFFGQTLVCRDFRYTLRLIYPGDNPRFAARRRYPHAHACLHTQ